MSFFSGVQSYFKDEHGGRYLGKIIIEWEKNDKVGFKKFCSSELGVHELPAKYQLTGEFPYKGGRYADLAILCDDRRPFALFEIKWNDTLTKETEHKGSQLQDYVFFCKKNACKMILLTRDSLAEDDSKELHKLGEDGQHKYVGSLSSVLLESRSPIAKMFFEYLQDKGVVMNEIDAAGLYRFFHRFVLPWKGAGRVAGKEQLASGPEQFGNLRTNMRLIAEEISPSFYCIKGVNRTATVDFWVKQYFSQKKQLLAVKKEGRNLDDEVLLDVEAKTGAEVFVYAIEKISDFPLVNIEYGFCFWIEPNKEHKMDVSIYACIQGREVTDPCYSGDESKKILKLMVSGEGKSSLVDLFEGKVAHVINNAIKKNQVGNSRKLGKVLKYLRSKRRPRLK